MKRLALLVSAALAGGCIALGGAVYLSVDSKAVGALLFTVGLFTIVTRGFHLYTGKVCYAVGKPASYLGELGVIWAGNFLGTTLVALLLRCSRVGEALTAKAAAVSEVKLGDGLLSLFLLAIFCNVMICVAVDGYKNISDPAGRYLALFFGVVVFILSGYEHCVANMFYFAMAGAWSGRMLVCLLVVTAGNAVGGMLLPNADAWLKRAGL